MDVSIKARQTSTRKYDTPSRNKPLSPAKCLMNPENLSLLPYTLLASMNAVRALSCWRGATVLKNTDVVPVLQVALVRVKPRHGCAGGDRILGSEEGTVIGKHGLVFSQVSLQSWPSLNRAKLTA